MASSSSPPGLLKASSSSPPGPLMASSSSPPCPLSSMASPPASPPREFKYDVFLSFRGPDTRRSFVSHLDAAFRRKAIKTFEDSRELEMGESILGGIGSAIETSRFAVVILSKNYASSRWCLSELEVIMELQRKERLAVFPVFFGVKPGDVRHQTGSFLKLFKMKYPETEEKVAKWIDALKQVADLSGAESSTL